MSCAGVLVYPITAECSAHAIGVLRTRTQPAVSIAGNSGSSRGNLCEAACTCCTFDLIAGLIVGVVGPDQVDLAARTRHPPRFVVLRNGDRGTGTRFVHPDVVVVALRTGMPSLSVDGADTPLKLPVPASIARCRISSGNHPPGIDEQAARRAAGNVIAHLQAARQG